MQLSLGQLCWFIALIIIWQRKPCNKLLNHAWAQWQTRRARQMALPEDEAIRLLESLASNVRAGATLSASISSPSNLTEILPQGVVQLLTFHSSSGAPALPNLMALKRQYVQMRKARWRAMALSAQARAQSTIIGAFPYLLLPALFLIDSEGVRSLFSSSSSVAALLLAAILGALGRYWVDLSTQKALTVNRAGRGALQILSTNLLSLSASVRAGLAPNSFAFEQEALSLLDQSSESAPHSLWQRLHQLIKTNQTHGVPILTELDLLLEETQVEMDSRLEESLQTLPVRLLLPLFLCQLPAALLVLLAYLWPQLSQFAA
jgi:hypothetical protein